MKKYNREYQFNITYSEQSLKRTAVKGGVSSVASQAIKLVMQTVATAILARILFPEDFGLIAMVTAISNFAILFKDLGLSTTIIQKQNLTYQEANNVFWLNIFLSLILTCIFIVTAPLMAMLYSEPRVTPLMMVIAATFFISGLGSLHYALARRQLKFWVISINEVMSMLAGVIVAIVMAYYGAKYWALLAQIVTQVIVSTLLIWVSISFIPSRPVWNNGVFDMLKFGGSISLYNALIYLSRNIDNVIVGTFLGAGPLGFYSKAYNILMMPMRQINAPLVTVALPTLSKLLDKPNEFKQFYLHATGIAALITVPLVFYSFVDADVLVMILLGEKWLAVIHTFRLLAPATFISAIHFLPGVLCVATGRPNIQLKWVLYSTPVFILGYLIGAKCAGIDGVAISFSITYPIAFIVFLRMSIMGSPLYMKDVFNELSAPFLSAIFASLLLFLCKLQFTIHLPLLLKPLMNILIFGISYLIILSALPSGRMHLNRIKKIRKNVT